MDIIKNKKAFSLTELLIVISIISMLTGVVLPSLRKVRHIAYQLACSANTSAIADGIFMYAHGYDGLLPAAYDYIDSGTNTPLIKHWSSVLQNYNVISDKHLICPVFAKRGLPPQSTTNNNLEIGQISAVPGKFDAQAVRCAYTVNEALCTRNRFTVGFENAIRINRYVNIAEVEQPGKNILVTEWSTNWKILSVSGTGLCNSYLPVHGAKALGTNLHYNLNAVPLDISKPCFQGGIYEKLTVNNLSLWQSPLRAAASPLDLVGRNHGICGKNSRQDTRKSSFAYMDGHVECKSIFDTINTTFEWGNRVYSIAGSRNEIRIK